ncbi:TIGR02281 family clan AA aspartic protease [Rhizobium sp. ZW T2_16]|uniref:retropepsin-like aspartic protease family protein n=1 Tax=Rhizobium sp. ZW T2_16 TaxID=3378083 RepID=UPI003854566A
MKAAVFYLFVATAVGFVLFFNTDSLNKFGYLPLSAPLATLSVAALLIARRPALFIRELQLMAWLLLLIVLMFGYISRNDLYRQGSRLIAALVPGQAIALHSNDGMEVLIYKTEGSHFETTVKVNGRDVSMLVDTGASQILLSYSDAHRLGVLPDPSEFVVPIATASGVSVAARTKLDIVALGPIIRRNVPALVSPEGELSQTLLGMNYLSSLKSFQMTSDELRLQD